LTVSRIFTGAACRWLPLHHGHLTLWIQVQHTRTSSTVTLRSQPNSQCLWCRYLHKVTMQLLEEQSRMAGLRRAGSCCLAPPFDVAAAPSWTCIKTRTATDLLCTDCEAHNDLQGWIHVMASFMTLICTHLHTWRHGGLKAGATPSRCC
jgi:hypothetical protein